MLVHVNELMTNAVEKSQQEVAAPLSKLDRWTQTCCQSSSDVAGSFSSVPPVSIMPYKSAS